MMHPTAFYNHAKNSNLLITGVKQNGQNPHSLLLLPLTPRIKIFYTGGATFFTLLIPNFVKSFRKY